MQNEPPEIKVMPDPRSRVLQARGKRIQGLQSDIDGTRCMLVDYDIGSIMLYISSLILYITLHIKLFTGTPEA